MGRPPSHLADLSTVCRFLPNFVLSTILARRGRVGQIKDRTTKKQHFCIIWAYHAGFKLHFYCVHMLLFVAELIVPVYSTVINDFDKTILTSLA